LVLSYLMQLTVYAEHALSGSCMACIAL
jgi:hypothetical protein